MGETFFSHKQKIIASLLILMHQRKIKIGKVSRTGKKDISFLRKRIVKELIERELPVSIYQPHDHCLLSLSSHFFLIFFQIFLWN